jgi:hypothetical protein
LKRRFEVKWYTETDLRDFEPIWLLELVLGGRVYRFATETVSISSDDGDLLFHGTLSDVDVVSEMEFASEDFDLPSGGCSVVFRENLAKRIAQGADFGSATAELSLFRKDSGDDYDDRQVVLSGRVSLPSYGGEGDPVSLEIEADWLRGSVVKPDVEHVIDSSVWGRADDNAEGMIFPMIFGAPGAQGFAGSPIYVIDYDSGSGVTYGLVAGHLLTAANINVIRITNEDGAYSMAGESVANAIDGNGVTYSYVTLTGQYAAGDSYFARFDVAGGGLLNPFRRETASATATQVGFLQGAGDILRYLLHQSGAKVDDGKTAAAAELLNGYELDFFIAERVDVMEFIKDEILPLLPCSLRASSEGIYPVVWHYDATSSDAKAKLTADRHIYRDGDVEYQSTQVANEITLRYRYNARYAKLQNQVTITGDVMKKTGDFLWRNGYTITSRSRYGTRSLELETELVASRATAGRIINWMSRAYSAKHRRVSYRAPYKLGYLQVGDIVSITDSELFFEDQVVLLQAIEWGEEDLRFTFLLIPDLPRDTIPVG